MKNYAVIFLLTLILLLVFAPPAIGQEPTADPNEVEIPADSPVEPAQETPPIVVEIQDESGDSFWGTAIQLGALVSVVVLGYFLAGSYPAGTFDKLSEYGEKRAKEVLEAGKIAASKTPSPYDDMAIELGQIGLDNFKSWFASITEEGGEITLTNDPHELAKLLMNGEGVAIPPGVNFAELADIYNALKIEQATKTPG